MSTHASGPWTQGHTKEGAKCVWVNGKTEPAHTLGPNEDWIDCNTEANARLIAAAPDLLEALKEMVRMYELDWHDRKMPYYVSARAAIAKAKGKP